MTSYLLDGPAQEPVGLDEARAYLHIDAGVEDALVATLVTAARIHVESVTGRAMLAQSWRVVLDCWPPDNVVPLPVSPFASLTAITTYDATGTATNVSLTGVQHEAGDIPAALILPRNFATGALRDRQGIEIHYVAGYGADPSDVPAVLRQALLLLVAYWFENRDSVMLAGTGSVVPGGFDMLVAPYRMVRL